MAIDLSNYVEVSERIEAFRAKYPDGTYQTDLVLLPPALADRFIAVRALAYRTPDDPSPGIDMAWEPVPGKTPYTKDSELQNACTSAIGRAIIAVGAADARRGIASQEEVRNRQTPRQRPKNVDPETGEVFDAAAYARDRVSALSSWTDKERQDNYKSMAKELIGGKATTKDEIDQVIKSLAEGYYEQFPDESPFIEIEGQEALGV